MAYATPEEIAKAKEMDLLTYLRNYEPDELVKVANGTYCTREHDSLKISNGKWYCLFCPGYRCCGRLVFPAQALPWSGNLILGVHPWCVSLCCIGICDLPGNAGRAVPLGLAAVGVDRTPLLLQRQQ